MPLLPPLLLLHMHMHRPSADGSAVLAIDSHELARRLLTKSHKSELLKQGA
jgi:hypothetical protein